MKVLVIGEICVDKFVYCDIKRLSPEAPVPVLNPSRITTNAGMAGNTIENIKALNPDAIVFSLTQDEDIIKTRYVEDKSNHMFVRVDEGEENISRFKWTPSVDIMLGEADIVIVSDYDKGFLSNGDLKEIARKASYSILDSKRKLTNDIIDRFSFIKLNKSESQNNPDLKHPGLIITLGAEGAYWGRELITQENPQQTIDVSGAGDTFVAAFAIKYWETLEEIPSIKFANEKAAEVVSKRGVVVPS